MNENTTEQRPEGWNHAPSEAQVALRYAVAELRERLGWVETEQEGELVRDRASGRWYAVTARRADGTPAEVMNHQDRLDFTSRSLAKPGAPVPPTCPRCQCCVQREPCSCDAEGNHAGCETEWFDLRRAWVWCLITGDVFHGSGEPEAALRETAG